MSQRISWGPLELVVGADPVGPIIGWAAAARVLGVSRDTLARRRDEAGLASCTPWWADADDLRAWWVCLVGAPAAPAVAPEPEPEPPPVAPRRLGRRAIEQAALDVAALRRELLGGGRRR